MSLTIIEKAKMKKINFVVVLISAFLFYGELLAQEVQVKGVSTISYEGGVFSSEPDSEARSNATTAAKRAAWNKYTSRFNAARMKKYMMYKEEMIGQLDQYVNNVRVIDEMIDKDAKSIRTVVRVSINETAVSALLDTMSDAGQQSTGEGSPFVFLFLAREGTSTKVYQDKVVSISQSQTASKASEKFSASSTGAVSVTATKKMSKNTTGGSVERKRAKTSYVVSSSENIDAAFGDTLSTAGFEVISYDDVVSECGGVEPSVIKKEFSAKDSMSRPVRKKAIGAVRECEVGLFAVGTMDAGVQDIDPVSGNKRVFVSVRGQVWNVSKRLPRKVASIGPVQFSGLGPDDVVAKRNALILAAKEASRTIVDQLNAKGIR